MRFSFQVKTVNAKTINQKVSRALDKKAREIRYDLLAEVSLLFDHYLENSAVVKALRGANKGDVGGSDLQAEFGLTDVAANVGVENMKYILSESLNVNIQKNILKTGAGIKVVVSGLGPSVFSQLRNMPEGKYTSDPSGSLIAWMQWLVDAETVTIDGYGIEFGNFNTIYQRTGRARMRPLHKESDLTGRFPWILPKYARGNRGRNFIEDIINDPKFIETLKKQLKQAFLKKVGK